MRVLRLWKGIVAAQTGILKGLGNVRFRSEADMCSAKRYVRYGPIADIVTSRAPGGKLSKVVNFEQKIFHPSLASATRAGRSRFA